LIFASRAPLNLIKSAGGMQAGSIRGQSHLNLIFEDKLPTQRTPGTIGEKRKAKTLFETARVAAAMGRLQPRPCLNQFRCPPCFVRKSIAPLCQNFCNNDPGRFDATLRLGRLRSQLLFWQFPFPWYPDGHFSPQMKMANRA
jgi:hypothetical protein